MSFSYRINTSLYIIYAMAWQWFKGEYALHITMANALFFTVLVYVYHYVQLVAKGWWINKSVRHELERRHFCFSLYVHPTHFFPPLFLTWHVQLTLTMAFVLISTPCTTPCLCKSPLAYSNKYNSHLLHEPVQLLLQLTFPHISISSQHQQYHCQW